MAWLLVNTGRLPLAKPWDPYPFVMLAMLASVESILLTIFVLISQDRTGQMSMKRDNLDLQISLLTEHEVTRLIALTEQLMRHLSVPVPSSPSEMVELKSQVEPRAVVDAIDQVEAGGPTSPGEPR